MKTMKNQLVLLELETGSSIKSSQFINDKTHQAKTQEQHDTSLGKYKNIIEIDLGINVPLKKERENTLIKMIKGYFKNNFYSKSMPK